jgi:hypothetical protein
VSWTHLSDTRRKAKRKYTCLLCGLPIHVGELHTYRCGVDDGYFSSDRMHIECDDYTHKRWDIFDWESFSPGCYQEFREELEEWKAQQATTSGERREGEG